MSLEDIRLGNLRRKIIQHLPFGEKLWLILCLSKNILSGPEKVGFFGWDMFTPHSTPWNGEDKVSRDFNDVNNNFLELVAKQ